jgi:hypothetical protein
LKAALDWRDRQLGMNYRTSESAKKLRRTPAKAKSSGKGEKAK